MFVLTLFDDMAQCTLDEVQRLMPLVSPQRREEALRFKHLKGQYACLKSYVLLHQLLVEQGVVAADCYPEFERNAHGKPHLKGFVDVHFNLSHTQQAIAVALSDHSVGVDVEGFRPLNQRLLEYTMSEEEVARVRQSDHPEHLFSQLWTQKEAVFKYTGTGITHSIKQILSALPEGVEMQSALHVEQGYAFTVVGEKLR